MRLRLGKRGSVIFTVVYFVVTLLGRFYIEPYLMGHYWISIFIGLYFVALYWVLIKKKFLNFREESDTAEVATEKTGKTV